MTTASIERSTTKSATPATTTITSFNVLQAKNPDFLAAVTTLRSKASKHYDTFIVKGRKAMLQLLAEIYSQYHAAIETGKIAALIADLREKLKAEDVAIPAKASDCSVLIRYIFSDFTSKQIYTYGRTLEIARSKQTVPDDFIALVEQAGGLEKLCSANLANGGESATDSAVAVAITMAKNAPTAQTIPVADWAPTEKARIFIGIPDSNDTLKLVDAKMSEKSIEATLNRYRIDADEAKKAKETESKDATAREAGRLVIQIATERQTKVHLRVLTAEQELASAKASNSKQRIANASERLIVAKDALDEADMELAELVARFNPEPVVS